MWLNLKLVYPSFVAFVFWVKKSLFYTSICIYGLNKISPKKINLSKLKLYFNNLNKQHLHTFQSKKH